MCRIVTLYGNFSNHQREEQKSLEKFIVKKNQCPHLCFATGQPWDTVG